nr:MAG TPA: hypothetical protein [Caudoviricetes sp.]
MTALNKVLFFYTTFIGSISIVKKYFIVDIVLIK